MAAPIWLAAVWIGSVFAIRIMIFARPAIQQILRRAFKMKMSSAWRFEERLSRLARVVGIVLLIGHLFLG